MKLARTPFIILSVIFAILLNACSLLPKFLTGQSPQQVTPTVSAPGTANTTSGPVEIASLSAYTDDFGYFHVVGEITNTSASPITNVLLALSLQDAGGTSLLKDYDGNVTATVEFSPFVYTLDAGDSSPFDYSNSYEVIPSTYEVFYVSSDPATTSKGSVEIRNTHYVDTDSDTIYYFGELVNTGSEPVDISGFSVGMQDAGGVIKAASYSMNLVEYLAPAGDPNGLDTGPFGVTIWAVPEAGLTPQVYFYAAQVEARQTPTIELQYTHSYYDYYDRIHVVGMVTNSDTRQLSFPVQVALRDETGAILDTYYASMPMSLEPGQTMPFEVSSWTQINSNPGDQAAMSNLYMQIDPYWTWETTNQYKALAIGDMDLSDEGNGILHITGTTSNTSGVDLYSTYVFIWFTDGEDNVVGTEYTTLYPSGEAFTPNEEAVFDFYANLDPAADYSGYDYSLQVIGQVK